MLSRAAASASTVLLLLLPMHTASREAEKPLDTRKQMVHAKPVVDGSAHPELMPDEHAFVYFIRAAALTVEGDYARSRAYLWHLGIVPRITESDARANALARRIVTFATDRANQLRELEFALSRSVAQGDVGRVAELTQSKASILWTARADLRTTFGDSVAERIEVAINTRIKPRMKLVN